MKLSDIKGERTIEVIAEIIEPIANIATDEQAAELFKRKTLPEGMTPKQFLVKRIRKHAPQLLKTHKDDIITILSIIADVSPDEYCGALNLTRLIGDLIELFTDEVFRELFISAQSETANTPSTSAQENTTAAKA